MIVQCDRCDTRFELDEARVPKSGIRVRCSRCKQSFFLPHPSASPDEAIDEIASGSAASGSSAPGATQDLGRAGGRGESADEDGDWEFDADLPSEEAAEGESAFGSVDDFSSLMEEDLDVQEPDLSTGLELDGPGPSVAAPESSAPEQVDDPEDWNFLSEESVESVPVDPPPVAVATPPPRSVVREEARPVLVESTGVVRRTGRAIGWLVTIGLLATGAARGIAPVAHVASNGPASVAVGSLRAEAVRGHWIDTARSGLVYAVSGRLRNPGRFPVAAGSELQVVLLRADGSRLDAAAPAALAPLESVVREAPAHELWETQRRAARALATRPIEPGRSVAFLAVFDPLPPEAASFRIEPAPASPEPARGAEPEVVTSPTASPR